MIHEADRTLRQAWGERFAALPAPAREALRLALLDLRVDALARAEHCWRKHKAPMALYWKVVGVYAGHLARVLRRGAHLADAEGRQVPGLDGAGRRHGRGTVPPDSGGHSGSVPPERGSEATTLPPEAP